MASEKTGSFVLDYIQECIETDILTPNDICDRVKNEIAEIDQKLHELGSREMGQPRDGEIRPNRLLPNQCH